MIRRNEMWSALCPPGWSVWGEGLVRYWAARDDTDERGPNRSYPDQAVEDAIARADREGARPGPPRPSEP